MKPSKREQKKFRMELVKLIAPKMVQVFGDVLVNVEMSVLGVADKTVWLAGEIVAKMIYEEEE